MFSCWALQASQPVKLLHDFFNLPVASTTFSATTKNPNLHLPVVRSTFSAITRETRKKHLPIVCKTSGAEKYHPLVVCATLGAETNGGHKDKLHAARSCKQTCMYDGKRTWEMCGILPHTTKNWRKNTGEVTARNKGLVEKNVQVLERLLSAN